MVYTKGKNVIVTVEFKVLKRHILRPTLSIDMIQHVLQWERQKRCFGRRRHEPMAKKLMKCFLGKEDEDNRRQNNGQT